MDQVRTYSIRDLPLGRKGLLLIAMMVGNDYAEGIDGCGVEFAKGAALEGYADQVWEIGRTLVRANSWKRMHGLDFPS